MLCAVFPPGIVPVKGHCLVPNTFLGRRLRRPCCTRDSFRPFLELHEQHSLLPHPRFIHAEGLSPLVVQNTAPKCREGLSAWHGQPWTQCRSLLSVSEPHNACLLPDVCHACPQLHMLSSRLLLLELGLRGC